ncbi:TetR/AcrR family transcriptional regulator [uncultured Jatrophihabitans sp.]|uniref:TetR/AcrR family transcriptional regulator n=1 Tax=uncultured Jatrophihabitans sp. TaxID=1610747 RepID=UPI0035CA2E40
MSGVNPVDRARDDRGPHDDLDRRLIDEAARMFAEVGPSGLSLRKLATNVGTSTMSVYTRFGGKPGLLAAMHREGFRRLGQQLTHAGENEGGDNLLLEIGLAYRQAALDSPHLYGLMFGPLPKDIAFDPADDPAAAATYAPLVQGVRVAVDNRDLVGDPERIALHLWVVAHGMVSLELSGQLPVPPDEAKDAYVQALWFAAQPFIVE